MTRTEKKNFKKRFDRANNPNSKRRIRRIKEERELIKIYKKDNK